MCERYRKGILALAFLGTFLQYWKSFLILFYISSLKIWYLYFSQFINRWCPPSYILFFESSSFPANSSIMKFAVFRVAVIKVSLCDTMSLLTFCDPLNHFKNVSKALFCFYCFNSFNFLQKNLGLPAML